MIRANATMTALSLLCALALAACARVEAPSSSQESSTSATPTPAALAALAGADAADGTVDKIVSKCVVCALAMDGSPEHAAAYGGYAVHLCSKECREAFFKEPEGVLRALK